MGADYRGLMESEAGSGNPYTAMFEAEAAQTASLERMRLGAATTLSEGVDPDEIARQRKTAAFLGLHPGVVEADPQSAMRSARIKKLELDTAKTPTLRLKYTDADFNRLAHDDSGVLSGIESVVRKMMNGGPTVFKPKQNAVMNNAEFSAAIARAKQENPALDDDTARALVAQGARIDNRVGLSESRGPAPSVASIFRGLTTASDASSRGFSVMAADMLGLDSFSAIRRYDVAKSRAAIARPEFETSTGSGIYGGAESLVQNAPGIALSLLTGNPLPGLAYAGGNVAGESYGKYRSRGGTPGQAALGAGLEGSIEVATEMLPMSFMVNKLGKAGASEFMKGMLAREIPGEQIATLAQDAVDTAIANPDKTWGQYIAERPDAAYQTLLATIVQGGAMGAVNTVAAKASGYDEQAARAQQTAEQVTQLAVMAQESKLRERAPDEFNRFIQNIAESSDTPTELYIDAQQLANTLNQSAITMEQLRAFAPAVAAQLDAAAFVPGADVRVPLGELMAAGPDLTTALVEHLRETPDAMSMAEAGEFTKNEGPKIQADVEAELSRQEQDTAYQQGVDQAAQRFEAELNAVGKFRPEVNKAYASMLGNFYASQAKRLGITPQELMDKYQLRVTAKDVRSANTLEQAPAPDTPEFKNWFGDSKVLDAEGKPLVVYHGTAAQFDVFDFGKIGSQGRAEGPGFYFTSNKDVAKGYGTPVEAYLSIRKPLTYDAKPFRAAVVEKIVKRIAEIEAEAEGGDIRDGFLSNFGDTYTVGIEGAAREAAKLIAADETAVDQISGIVGSGVSPEYVLRAVTEVTGHDGVTAKGFSNSGDTGNALYVAFNPTQIKSATGNRGTFDPASPNILEQPARANLNFASDITTAPSVIALLEGADLSSFLHESGHFFLEVQADLAARLQASTFGGTNELTPAEQGIVDDMTTLLKWFGVTDTPEASALDQWAQKSLDERREAHETFARGFERYAMEGKAPSQELQALFAKFRAWLVSIYKTLKGLNVELNDDVRAVMDRMLATDEAIQAAQDAANMGPLFQSPEQAGMTPEEYAAYQALGERATGLADKELDARLMKDMKWLSKARDKALKAAQAEVDGLRREVTREVRAEVMSTSIYRAWAFLTGKGERSAGTGNKAAGEQTDNLFTAIAKLGGLNRDELKKQWGLDPKEKLASGVFGSPVVRKEGGLSLDMMGERLIELGYLLPDENGKADLAKLEALFDDQRRGIDRYSISKQFAGDEEIKPLDLPEVASGRLNTNDLKRQFGDEADARWRLLSERRMTSPDGLPVDAVADVFEFTSGDHLVQTLVRTRPPEEVIAELVDRAMLERYGDIASDEALNRAADEAVHNELRARVVAAELKALDRSMSVRTGRRSTVNVMAETAKNFAAQVIARQKIRDLRPGQYMRAAARNARQAQELLGRDLPGAAEHKRNQLVNTFAAMAAFEAQDEVRSAQKYFRKFESRIKSIDPAYQEQIDQLLEDFDFRPTSLVSIDRRKSFAEWYAAQQAEGNEPSVPPELLAAAARKSFKDMTVEELRGLVDTIKQIEHMGRMKNRLLLARDKRDFDAAASAMTDSIVKHGGNERPVHLEGPAPVADWFAGVAAMHRKLSSLFRQMDGGKDDGPMYDLIGRGMNERGTMEDVMIEKATLALRELYAPLLKMRGGITGYRSKIFIPEINDSLTRGGRLAVALNWGNEANRQRIMDGDQWGEGQVRAILKTLSPAELKFVNDVWAYIDTFWPEVSAKEKRLTGVEPEKVEAVPFNVIASDGTEVAMRGGYYPLKYDTDRSDRADQQEAAQAAKEMMQGAFTRATTRRGHTKERLKEVKRAVRKDLNVITQHVTQVVHDLAWHEWLIDTNKLLGDDRVAGAIRGHYGPKVLKTIRDGVLGIATADVVPQSDIDKALLTLRSNVTRATMGASLTTAFLQPFGLTQSMVRIGPKFVLRGVARWGGDAARMESTVGWIREKSDFMRLRAKTFNKELREIRGSVQGKSKTMRVIDAGLFVMMQKMQMVADVPTWVGQYEKSLAEGKSEADAVAMADRAVLESQGGGQTKDLAEVQRKHPMLTQFYSYFSVTLNLAAESTATTDFKDPAAVAGWLGDMALLMVIPAILPALLMHVLKGGGDDDDEKRLVKRMAEWQVSYLLGTVVGLRELSGAVSGFDYAGPPVGRIVADLGKAAKQIAQGELDEPAVQALTNLLGDAFGIPTVQAMRSYKGWKAWSEGRMGAGPQSILFGPPPHD